MANRPRPFRFTVQASRLSHPDDLRPLARRSEDLGVSVLTVADHLDDQLAPIAALMAVPFAVISSAVAIPSSEVLVDEDREYVIYESSWSDIIGVWGRSCSRTTTGTP